jgi:protein-tyrosine-phosphatase
LVEYYDVQSGTVELTSDGIQALAYVFDMDKSVTSANNSYDLIIAMRKMIAESRRIWKWRHVKGHHDIQREQLNDVCDTEAKSFWATYRQQH